MRLNNVLTRPVLAIGALALLAGCETDGSMPAGLSQSERTVLVAYRDAIIASGAAENCDNVELKFGDMGTTLGFVDDGLLRAGISPVEIDRILEKIVPEIGPDATQAYMSAQGISGPSDPALCPWAEAQINGGTPIGNWLIQS